MLPFCSVEDIIVDLQECVLTGPTKVAKRLARLRMLYDCVGREMPELDVPVEQVTDVTHEQLFGLLESKVSAHSGEVALPGTARDETCKRMIEAALTSALNHNLDVYTAMLEHTSAIIDLIRYHPFLGPYFAAGDIKFLHKGGIATRIVLLREFPHRREEICEKFALGGDNDCTIIINPALDNFDEVHARVVTVVHVYMSSHVDEAASAAERAAEVADEVVLLGMHFGIRPSHRGNFKIRNNGTAKFREPGEKSVYYTYNDALDFNNCGVHSHFTLMRWKHAFEFDLTIGAPFAETSRPFGAEMLDISVSHRDDYKASMHFHDVPYYLYVTPEDGY